MPLKLTGEPAAGFAVVTLNAADGSPWTVTDRVVVLVLEVASVIVSDTV